MCGSPEGFYVARKDWPEMWDNFFRIFIHDKTVEQNASTRLDSQQYDTCDRYVCFQACVTNIH